MTKKHSQPWIVDVPKSLRARNACDVRVKRLRQIPEAGKGQRHYYKSSESHWIFDKTEATNPRPAGELLRLGAT